MPNRVIPTYVPYEKRRKYPHMGYRDAEIWERFIAKYPNIFTRVAYDVACGIGTELNTVVNPATGGDMNRLYQYKADVLGDTPDATYVVEVKPRAGPSAVGQVKHYIALLERDMVRPKRLVPMIVTDESRPEMEFYTAREGVAVFVV